MEAAEVKFKEFQWADNSDWQNYWNNIFPTPPLSKVDKYKRSWFRLNVDSNLSLTPPAGSTTQSHRSSPTDNPPYCYSFQVTLEIVLRLLFLCLAVPLFLVSLLGVINNTMVAIYFIAVSLHYSLSVVGILREKGFPKFNMEWLQSALYLDMAQYLIYGFIFLVSKFNTYYFVAPIATCLIGYNSLMEKHYHQIPKFLSPCAFALFKLTKQGFSFLLHFRGDVECYMIFYLVVQALTGYCSFVTVIMYFNFLKIRLSVRDAFIIFTFNRINDAIVKVLSYRFLGPLPLTIYTKLCDILLKLVSFRTS